MRLDRKAALAALALVGGGMSAGALVAAVPATAVAAGGTTANPYSPAYGHAYRRGVVPTIGQLAKMNSWARTHLGVGGLPVNFGSETLSYGGGIDGIGVTSGTPKVYLVFWGSQWGTQGTDSSGNLTFSNDPDQGAPYIQNLFKGLGTGGELWSGTMTQYCDGSSVASGATSCPAGAAHVGYPTGGALAGVWYDNSAPTPSAATGNQIGTEAVRAAAHFGNTTPASNRYVQYDILSPHGADPDSYQSNGFCAWHDYNKDSSLTGGPVASPYGDIAFTNMPYVMDVGSSCGQGFVNSPGTLDGYSIVNGHEFAETVTDQNPAGGWTNQQTLSTYSGEENGDECAWISSGQGAAGNVATAHGTFAMQSTWSNDTNRCDLSHPIVSG
jgi:serine protease